MRRSLLSLALILAACTPQATLPPTQTASTQDDHEARVARGAYLVTVMTCNDCHTPFKMGPAGPEPDMSRMLSGHPEELALPDPPALGEGPWLWVGAATNTAFAGPWGISYAPNLTPDPSGLSAWDEALFIRTLRSGQHWGVSRPILPPMPWQSYRELTDEDLGAVFAYLQSVPPIRNHAPDSQPALPAP